VLVWQNSSEQEVSLPREICAPLLKKSMQQFFAQNFGGDNTAILIIVALWTLPWKGIALWKSARRKELGWFIALLVVNLVGILEILYIFVFSKRNEIPREGEGPR